MTDLPAGCRWYLLLHAPRTRRNRSRRGAPVPQDDRRIPLEDR